MRAPKCRDLDDQVEGPTYEFGLYSPAIALSILSGDLVCNIVLSTTCESLYKQVTTLKLLYDNSLVSAG